MTPFVSDPDFTLYVGDVRQVLAELPDNSVDCVVTSPPYWGLRDYGTGQWAGGNPDCDHTHKVTPRRDAAGGQFLPTRGDQDARAGLNTVPYRDVCGHCGASRVDQQIGLEATPEQFVQQMVAVFREVRRVLAPHGTLWLNLGDSYAAGGGFAPDAPSNTREAQSDRGIRHRTQEKFEASGQTRARGARAAPSGLKPKDLVGIPWRVAFALQQPYYAGRIKDERDRIWLAAMVDTEGCIHIHKRSAGVKSHTHTLVDGSTTEYHRKTDTYGVMVSIDNTSKALIDRIEAIVGQGSRYTHEKGVGKSNRKQTLYRITLTGQQSRELLRELYPHLVAKQREARIAYHAPSSGEGAEAAWQAIKALHNGLDTTVDYPDPATLFEPGWYLRSDVIWGKPNPMPESVTDRPTKAHEYVFLLTKQPRYFFDQEAVREPAEWARWGDQTVGPGSNPNGWIKPRSREDLLTRGPGGNLKDAPKDGYINGGGWAAGPVPADRKRNVRSVWEIATQPYPDAHFATFPEALPERCIKAGCPEQVCVTCGEPRVRIVESRSLNRNDLPRDHPEWRPSRYDNGKAGDPQSPGAGQRFSDVTTLGWSDCGHGNYRTGVVLDPFMGSGTTALVARRLGRRSIGVELNEAYAALCARRLQQLSLFAEEQTA